MNDFLRLAICILMAIFIFQTPGWSIHLETINSKCSVNTQPINIRLHLTVRSDHIKSPPKLADDLSWLKAQLTEANHLFKSIGVCFVISNYSPLPSSESHMKTRRQRTQLGRQVGRLTKGQIDLFVVNRLDDVDVADTEIRGVHWRDPSDRKNKRWIILSRIARSKVLAHELGHYFDLPHSRYAQSIMNKTPRKKPPMSKRGFVKAEYRIMMKAKQRMLRTGHLFVAQ